MKILVTGATGCVGRNLAERLLKEGHQVTVNGRNEKIGEILKKQGASFKLANLEKQEESASLFLHQDIVYHCAALSSVWGRYDDFYAANVLATKNVISGCMKHKIQRLIYVSTPSLYFDFQDRFNIHETDALTSRPVNHYVKTKMFAEQAIDDAFNKGLPVITIRPRGIFGPYDTAILPRIINMNQRGKLPLINHGKAIVDLTYVGNVVEALSLCQAAPNSCLGKKYNISNGEPIELFTFLQELFNALEISLKTRNISYKTAYVIAMCMELFARITNSRHEPKITRYSVGVLSKSQTLNIDAAWKELNYVPKYSLEEGIALTASWWKQNGNC